MKKRQHNTNLENFATHDFTHDARLFTHDTRDTTNPQTQQVATILFSQQLVDKMCVFTCVRNC